MLAGDAFGLGYPHANAYGASLQLRLHIRVNNFTAVGMTTGEVRLESDRSPWRPLVHVEDINRASSGAIEASRAFVPDAFNGGRPEDNAQAHDVAELVRDAVPGSKASFAERAEPDLRNYCVHFSKLAETCADVSVREGVDAQTEHGLTYDDFVSPRFVRLRWIREPLPQASSTKGCTRRSARGSQWRCPDRPRGSLIADTPTRSWPAATHLALPWSTAQ